MAGEDSMIDRLAKSLVVLREQVDEKADAGDDAGRLRPPARPPARIRRRRYRVTAAQQGSRCGATATTQQLLSGNHSSTY